MQNTKHNMQSKEDLLIENLLRFFSKSHNLEIFRAIVDQNKYISLRLLDWFATNYCKLKQIWIHSVDVHKNYKQNLKGYKKKYFDPFCRHKRVYLYGRAFSIKTTPITNELNDTLLLEYTHTVVDKDYIETTVGQLNFFRWCIQKGVIEYILDHHREIEEHMAECKDKASITTNKLYKKDIRVTIYFA